MHHSVVMSLSTEFQGGPGNLLCEYTSPLLQGEQEASIARQLYEKGFAITPGFLTPSEVRDLNVEGDALWREGAFREARVGQGPKASLQSEIRSDRVHWLDQSSASKAQMAYLSRLSSLREEINRQTFAGLFDWEGHLAVYPEGAFYRPHLDRFETSGARIVTTVLYLNEHWEEGMGGELRLWLEATKDNMHAPEGPYIDVAPLAGTLVTFWSDQFVHEVRTAHFERMSITGWFRHRIDNALRFASFE